MLLYCSHTWVHLDLFEFVLNTEPCQHFEDVWYFTIYTGDPVWLWGRWRIWCVIGQIQSYSQREPMMHSVQELLLIIHPWAYCRWLINCQSSDKDQAHDSLWPLSVFSGCFSGHDLTCEHSCDAGLSVRHSLFRVPYVS